MADATADRKVPAWLELFWPGKEEDCLAAHLKKTGKKQAGPYRSPRPSKEPFHGRAFSVPKAYKKQLRNEIQRLLNLGVLHHASISEWAAPSFGVSKKNQQIRSISGFRHLNERIIRKPFPLPQINEMRRTLDGFTFVPHST